LINELIMNKEKVQLKTVESLKKLLVENLVDFGQIIDNIS